LVLTALTGQKVEIWRPKQRQFMLDAAKVISFAVVNRSAETGNVVNYHLTGGGHEILILQTSALAKEFRITAKVTKEQQNSGVSYLCTSVVS